MPAPSIAMLHGVALSAVPLGNSPQAGQKLAAALSKVMGAACSDFVRDVIVDSGIPCAVTSPAMMGNVVGIGRLSGTCPPEALIRMNATSIISSSGMTRHGQGIFVDIVTKITSKGLSEFMASAQLLPGTAIANGITATPGKLTVPIQAINTQLDMLAQSMLPRPGAGPAVSELPPDFPKIVAKLMKAALEQMMQMIIVAAGVPVAGSVTAAHARLT